MDEFDPIREAIRNGQFLRQLNFVIGLDRVDLSGADAARQQRANSGSGSDDDDDDGEIRPNQPLKEKTQQPPKPSIAPQREIKDINDMTDSESADEVQDLQKALDEL